MTAFLGPIFKGAASAGLGALASRGFRQKRVKPPKFQRELVDQLLQGLQGEGPFAQLFQADQEAFQRGVSDPLLQQFREQTAPQIQQRFIAEGQQRGTPLESALTRAGVDVQSNINRQFLPFQQGAQNRQQQAINQLLGIKQQMQSQVTPFGGALAGILGSGAVGDISEQIGDLFSGSQGGVAQGQPAQAAPAQQVTQTPRRGFRLPGFLEGF